MKRILITTICILFIKFGFAGNSSNSNNSVTGTVLDADTKKPLADVTIVASSGSNKSEVITTNAQGQFKIPVLPQGSYTIKFSKDEYKTLDKKEVVIKSDNTIKLTIELISESMETTNHRSWWDKFDIYL